MKGNDEITGLFRSRLSGAEMTVRDGFWEELKGDLSRVETDATNTSATVAFGQAGNLSGQKQKRSVLTPRFYRVAAAASVVLVLGAASAAFWYFSPKDEIQEAFTKVATLTPEGNLNGDVVQEKFPSIHETKPTAQNPGHKNPVPVSSGGILAANGDDEETVSVTVSITISQRVYGNHHQGNGMYGQTASSRNENNHHAKILRFRPFAANRFHLFLLSAAYFAAAIISSALFSARPEQEHRATRVDKYCFHPMIRRGQKHKASRFVSHYAALEYQLPRQ